MLKKIISMMAVAALSLTVLCQTVSAAPGFTFDMKKQMQNNMIYCPHVQSVSGIDDGKIMAYEGICNIALGDIVRTGDIEFDGNIGEMCLIFNDPTTQVNSTPIIGATVEIYIIENGKEIVVGTASFKAGVNNAKVTLKKKDLSGKHKLYFKVTKADRDDYGFWIYKLSVDGKETDFMKTLDWVVISSTHGASVGEEPSEKKAISGLASGDMFLFKNINVGSGIKDIKLGIGIHPNNPYNDTYFAVYAVMRGNEYRIGTIKVNYVWDGAKSDGASWSIYSRTDTNTLSLNDMGKKLKGTYDIKFVFNTPPSGATINWLTTTFTSNGDYSGSTVDPSPSTKDNSGIIDDAKPILYNDYKKLGHSGSDASAVSSTVSQTGTVSDIGQATSSKTTDNVSSGKTSTNSITNSNSDDSADSSGIASTSEVESTDKQTSDNKPVNTQVDVDAQQEEGFPIWGIAVIAAGAVVAVGAVVLFFVLQKRKLDAEGEANQ